MTFAPAYPHNDISEIAPDVYMARGSLKMNAVMRISRNMAIVRHNDELLSAHGTLLETGVHAAVTAAVKQVYKK